MEKVENAAHADIGVGREEAQAAALSFAPVSLAPARRLIFPDV